MKFLIKNVFCYYKTRKNKANNNHSYKRLYYKGQLGFSSLKKLKLQEKTASAIAEI